MKLRVSRLKIKDLFYYPQIEIGNIELSGYLNGHFIGMPEAPFDNLKLDSLFLNTIEIIREHE